MQMAAPVVFGSCAPAKQTQKTTQAARPAPPPVTVRDSSKLEKAPWVLDGLNYYEDERAIEVNYRLKSAAKSDEVWKSVYFQEDGNRKNQHVLDQTDQRKGFVNHYETSDGRVAQIEFNDSPKPTDTLLITPQLFLQYQHAYNPDQLKNPKILRVLEQQFGGYDALAQQKGSAAVIAQINRDYGQQVTGIRLEDARITREKVEQQRVADSAAKEAKRKAGYDARLNTIDKKWKKLPNAQGGFYNDGSDIYTYGYEPTDDKGSAIKVKFFRTRVAENAPVSNIADKRVSERFEMKKGDTLWTIQRDPDPHFADLEYVTRRQEAGGKTLWRSMAPSKKKDVEKSFDYALDAMFGDRNRQTPTQRVQYFMHQWDLGGIPLRVAPLTEAEKFAAADTTAHAREGYQFLSLTDLNPIGYAVQYKTKWSNKPGNKGQRDEAAYLTEYFMRNGDNGKPEPMQYQLVAISGNQTAHHTLNIMDQNVSSVYIINQTDEKGRVTADKAGRADPMLARGLKSCGKFNMDDAIALFESTQRRLGNEANHLTAIHDFMLNVQSGVLIPVKKPCYEEMKKPPARITTLDVD